MLKLLCELLFGVMFCAKLQPDSLVVQTNSGMIEGQYVHSPVINKSYYSFRGIPYAEPPLGELRFRPPVAPKPWSYVRESKADGSACLQTLGGSEDCLYLNVYTPTLPNVASNVLLPVMVSIHGGAFIMGSSNSSSFGPDFLIDKNVVLVTMNYRLNVFGFLNAMEESAPGNVGLKDQAAALQWVQQNIKQFNGDPKRVTLMGQSAGAASVQYHMQSKVSAGLFDKAILQSGSTLNHWAFEQDPIDLIYKLGKLLNVESRNITNIINEFRIMPAKQLLKASENEELLDSKHRTLRSRFVPSIEKDSPNAFITDNSYSILEGNKIVPVPLLTGYVSNEEILLLWDQSVYTNFSDYENDPLLLVPKALNIFDDITSQKLLLEEINKQYFNNESIPFNISFIAYESDEAFVRGIRKTFEFLRNNNDNIYHYMFDYRSNNKNNMFYYNSEGVPGASHCAELQYIFYGFSTTETEEERVIRDRMTTLWTNFARTGNPTPNKDPELDNITWPQVPKPQEDVQYLYIGNQLEVRKESWQELFQFWENIFTTYGKPPFYIY